MTRNYLDTILFKTELSQEGEEPEAWEHATINHKVWERSPWVTFQIRLYWERDFGDKAGHAGDLKLKNAGEEHHTRQHGAFLKGESLQSPEDLRDSCHV